MTGRPVMLRPDTGGFTVRLRVWVRVVDVLSWTWSVKLDVPVPVGAPEIVPPVLRLRPAGRLPETIVQVYGVVPPIAVTLCVYGEFWIAAGRVVVVIAKD